VKISSKVDVWSVGVIFYELLFGRKPFGDQQTQQAILKNQTILNAGEVEFPPKATVTDACKDFIRKCLEKHPSNRYDVHEAFYSPYLRGGLQKSKSKLTDE